MCCVASTDNQFYVAYGSSCRMDGSNFLKTQGPIKNDQLINVNACVKVVVVSQSSPNNNSTVSGYLYFFSLTYVAAYFCSIVVDPDSLSIAGSEIVQHNVGPAGCRVKIC